jgi:hypothetical protein
MLSDEELAELGRQVLEIAKLANEHPDSVCIDQLIGGWRASIEAHGQLLYCSKLFPKPKEALGNLKNEISKQM